MGVKKKILNKPAWNICHKAQQALGTGAQQTEGTSEAPRKWCKPNTWFLQHHLFAATLRRPAELVWTPVGALPPLKVFHIQSEDLCTITRRSPVHLVHRRHCVTCVAPICFSQSVVTTATTGAAPPLFPCTFCLWPWNLLFHEEAVHRKTAPPYSPWKKKNNNNSSNKRTKENFLVKILPPHPGAESTPLWWEKM